MQRDADPTPNELQRALLEYQPTDLEELLIAWTQDHWNMAARAMVYNKPEGDKIVSGVSASPWSSGLIRIPAARITHGGEPPSRRKQ